MPELPDILVYVDALARHLTHRRLDRIHLRSPFVLRSVDPPVEAAWGREVRTIDRVGKRLVLGLGPPVAPDGGSSAGSASSRAATNDDNELFLVVHLMIAGRLKWAARGPDGVAGKRPSPKLVLAEFEFEHGTLFFTEASSKKRASLQLVDGREAVAALDPGGIEPLDATFEQFRDALTREQHTVKRALTDPHLVSGIGNAYSDEILHAAKLSPLKLTRSLSEGEHRRLYDAVRSTLTTWIDRLREEAGDGFPEKVTAFRRDMAVHGRFREPCPVCGSPVQRIVYAENECNYCARCQTGGRLLADRSLSRLLKDDWPRSIDDL